MYNRYIRNDQGAYSRVPQQEASPSPPPESKPDHAHIAQNTPHSDPITSGESAGAQQHTARPVEIRWLNRLLGKLRLSDIDAGDLLLLLLLFILFREGGDEELLIAIGLLLIM